jgi:Xaa-Pro aminopeptidase
VSGDKTEFRHRLDALDEALRPLDVEAAVVTHPPCVRYLTGFSGSSGCVYHELSGPSVLITDFRYEEQAAAEVPEDVRVHISTGGWIAALADIRADAPDTRIAFEPEHMTVLEYDRLEERVEGAEFHPVRKLVGNLRAVKSESEIAAIGAATGVAERALDGLLVSVDWRKEPTELDVAAALEHELRRAGSEGLPFEVIVASGERTSLPHAAPSSRPILTGDLVLIDFGAIVDGYCSDITRTCIVGQPADWQTEIHGRVLEAQIAAIDTIGPGVGGVDVDRAARETLAGYDLDEYFGHSTGHGIGLEVHEDPRLSTRSDDILEPGNVVTVEPGVYLPGRGGVRIEDDVAVTTGGSRVLTSASRDLVRL